MARPLVISRTCVVAAAALLALAATDCYSNDQGSPPPLDELYFPVGLQVSAGGNVLYAVNSNFDLQYNGGTLQSYDLFQIRQDAVKIIANPRDPSVKVVDPKALEGVTCPERIPTGTLGESCAPPVDAAAYVRDAAIIGAFATDLVLSKPPASLVPASKRTSLDEKLEPGRRRFDRLFTPIRGNASLAWASVERDSATATPTGREWAPFKLQCGQDGDGRCNGFHAAGANPEEKNNTRGITMPGEPFGIAMSEDGESILVTHQNEQKTSLFDSGLKRSDPEDPGSATDQGTPPSLQFVLEGVPIGGVGLAAIPHDRDAYLASGGDYPRPSFLQTSRAVPQLTILRRQSDEFGGISAAQQRPFLELEPGPGVAFGAAGNDSRGIVIDPTPRLACKAKVADVDPTRGRAEEDKRRDLEACARKPARVYIANRSPAQVLVGDVGIAPRTGDPFDPDRVRIHTTIPLNVASGPSKLYLAPVVERDGRYGLRLFAVCFDAATVFVIDPATNELENVIRVGLGPFAMAFDPFDMNDVATAAEVPLDTRFNVNGEQVRRYRFAYIASFTNSFVQVIDLDGARTVDPAQNKPATYERIVFTLGQPRAPKGS